MEHDESTCFLNGFIYSLAAAAAAAIVTIDDGGGGGVVGFEPSGFI